MAAAGASGQADVTVDNCLSVGDIQAIIRRIEQRFEVVEHETAMNASGTQQQLAALRVDVRTLQIAPPAAAAKRYDLIDTNTMSRSMLGGTRADYFKAWAKNTKSYTNAKLPGYPQALESCEKLGKDSPVDRSVIDGWRWGEALEANSRLHDMLMLVTSGEAIGIVESAPGRGFDAWRLLNVRFNSVGEMYTYDKMNAIMKQSPVKHLRVSGVHRQVQKRLEDIPGEDRG